MGRRMLKISPELLVQLCQGMKDGPPRCFIVEKDPLPDDVKVVSVAAWAWPETFVEIELESDSWESAEPAPYIEPWFRSVDCPHMVGSEN